jgi:hypothetical protein
MMTWHKLDGRIVVETFGHIDQMNESAEEVQRNMRAEGYRRVRIIERRSTVSKISITRRYVVALEPAPVTP